MTNRSNFGDNEAKLRAMHEADYPGGVVVDPTPISFRDEITVFYNGLLAKSGADQVYLHTGYGAAREWKEIRDVPMDRTGWGWVTNMQMTDDSRFNFCFKDSAQNWDNNNGANWSFEIHNGERGL